MLAAEVACCAHIPDGKQKRRTARMPRAVEFRFEYEAGTFTRIFKAMIEVRERKPLA
jgi:hypothetical protein